MARQKSLTLRAQEHQEAMDLLQMAASTDNAAIAKLAASMAQERMRYRHSQSSKISPGLAVGLATAIGVASVCGCGFVLVKFPGKIGLEISGIIIGIAVLLICLYLRISGHLTETNFMTIFKWFADHIKAIFNRGHTATDLATVQSTAADSSDTKLPK